MKKLSDFTGAAGIVVASRALSIIMDMLKNPKNAELNGETDRIKLFTGFMQNSPEHMLRLFALLCEEDPDTYDCDASTAMMNMMVVANDPVLMSLFISQGRRGGAKSSVSASVNTEV